MIIDGKKITNFLLGTFLIMNPLLFADSTLITENNKKITNNNDDIKKTCPISRENNNFGKLFLLIDGPDVVNFFRLGSETADFLWSNSEDGLYRMWNSSWKIPHKYGTIAFKAIAANDIAVGISKKNPWSVVKTGINLYDKLTNSNNMYEIVIGGWNNTQSVIRQGAQNDPVTTVGTGIVDTNVLIEYKIIMYHNHKNNKDIIAVYFFNPNTTQWQKLMKYNDSFFANGPRWFSLSSWDSNIFYTNLYVSTETKLPK